MLTVFIVGLRVDTCSDILKEHVDPMQESSDNGIDLFIAAKTFIENL